MRPRRSLEDRFQALVAVSQPDHCWLWNGPRDKNGYGRISAAGTKQPTLRAHRVAWELKNGAIPAGLLVLHRCDNPPCVNPAHLFLGTTADNNADMMKKGRHVSGPALDPSKMARGSAHGLAKLTEDAVRYIREAAEHGAPATILCLRFGVSPDAVRRVITRKTWRHV